MMAGAEILISQGLVDQVYILRTSPNKNGGEQVWFPSSIALLYKKCSKTLRLEPGPWMSKGNPTD